MRNIAVAAACVFLACFVAVLADLALELSDDLSVYIDVLKDAAGIVLAAAVLYQWLFARAGSGPAQA